MGKNKPIDKVALQEYMNDPVNFHGLALSIWISNAARELGGPAVAALMSQCLGRFLATMAPAGSESLVLSTVTTIVERELGRRAGDPEEDPADGEDEDFDYPGGDGDQGTGLN